MNSSIVTRDLLEPKWHFYLLEDYKKLCRLNKEKSIWLHLLAKHSFKGSEGDDRFEYVPAVNRASKRVPEGVLVIFFLGRPEQLYLGYTPC